ncbi:biotin/lipoate A/B protein ligase family protein [Spirochaetota bacterium]|nr:biotin/lipoate A/B protein ligase family protein [Spirochaetota bacterium]
MNVLASLTSLDLDDFLDRFLEEAVSVLVTSSVVLVIDKPLPGNINMDRDKSLYAYLANKLIPASLKKAAYKSSSATSSAMKSSSSPAIIRIYQWQHPTITIGRNQPACETLFDMESISDANISLVRRITGGRAVLHAHELTYAVMAAADHPILGGGIKESYTAIAKILMNFIKTVTQTGTPEIHYVLPRAQRSQNSASCYDSLGWAEITIDGRKLIGSAQRRSKTAFLEHGSIPVNLPKKQLEYWLKPAMQPTQPVNYTSLSQFTQTPPSFQHLSHTLAQCFLKALS